VIGGLFFTAGAAALHAPLKLKHSTLRLHLQKLEF